ncbi:MAG: hypothetical protein QM754_15450 [Tepidisphaeraceae bacterium]
MSQGNVFWKTNDGRINSTTIEVWPPTKSRGKELRLANFADVDAWKLLPSVFKGKPKKKGAAKPIYFYLLEMDDEGMVWARVISSDTLAAESTLLRDHIRWQQKSRGTKAIKGMVDHSSGLVYPERTR